MTDNTLLPCPFCGGDAHLMPDVSFQQRWWAVKCYNADCGVQPNGVQKCKQTAITAWNRRAPSAELAGSADIDALRATEATDLECLVMEICGDVAELPDRTSPEDQPDMMLVEFEELQIILTARLQPLADELEALRAAARDTAGLVEALRPFATAADEIEASYGVDLPEHQYQFPALTLGQFRAARAALNAHGAA